MRGCVQKRLDIRASVYDLFSPEHLLATFQTRCRNYDLAIVKLFIKDPNMVS